MRGTSKRQKGNAMERQGDTKIIFTRSGKRQILQCDVVTFLRFCDTMILRSEMKGTHSSGFSIRIV